MRGVVSEPTVLGQELLDRRLINTSKLRHHDPRRHSRTDVPELVESERPPVASPEEGSAPEVEHLVGEGAVGVGAGLPGGQVELVRGLVRQTVEEEHDGGEDEVDEVEVELFEIGLLAVISSRGPHVNSAAEKIEEPEDELRARGDTAAPEGDH